MTALVQTMHHLVWFSIFPVSVAPLACLRLSYRHFAGPNLPIRSSRQATVTRWEKPLMQLQDSLHWVHWLHSWQLSKKEHERRVLAVDWKQRQIEIARPPKGDIDTAIWQIMNAHFCSRSISLSNHWLYHIYRLTKWFIRKRIAFKVSREIGKINNS